MISMEQIDGEIAVLEEEKPTYIVMQKLANLYTVRSHMIIKNQELPENKEPTEKMDYLTDSEFSRMVAKKGMKLSYTVIDELMATLSVINPNLYNGVLRKLSEL